MKAVALLAVVAVVAAIAVTARVTAPIVTDSDLAVSQVYVELAAKGELWLGPYSRFGWHHPGPMLFYLIAPFYVWAGHQAAVMFSVALVINIGAIGLIGVVAWRESGRVLAASLVTGLLVLSWRAEPFLASPWNAHVAILPALAALVLAAAVMTGSTGWLPCLAVAASLAVQSHVGFAPTLLIISFAAVCAAGMVTSSHQRPSRMIAIGLVTALALWLPVMIEALTNEGGNLAELWRFFVADEGPHKSIRYAVGFGAYCFTSVWRGDFRLAWSDRIQVTDPFPYIFALLATLVVLVAFIHRDLARSRRFDAVLGIVAVTATLIGMWGMTRIKGPVLHYDLMRLAALGAFNYAIIASASIRVIAPALRLPRMPSWSAVLAGGMISIVLAVALSQLHLLTSRERRPGRERITQAYDAVTAHLTRHNIKKAEVAIGRDRWGEAASVIAQLVRDGRSIALSEEHVFQFTPALRADGRGDAHIWFADADLHQELAGKPGTELLLAAPPLYVYGTRPK